AHPDSLRMNPAGLYSTSPALVAEAAKEAVLSIKTADTVRLAVGSPFFAVNPSTGAANTYLNVNQSTGILAALESLAHRRAAKLAGGSPLAGQRELAEQAAAVFGRMKSDIPVGAALDLSPGSVLHPTTLAILNNGDYLPTSG